MGILAQLGTTNSVPPLPGPPLVERVLLEQPLPVVVLGVVAAAVAFFVLNRQGRATRAAVVGLALLGVGAAVAVVAGVVRTERERMAEATRELVMAAAGADVAGLTRLLSPDVRLFSRFSAPGYGIGSAGIDREEILEKTVQLQRQFSVREAEVREVQSVSTGPGVGSTQVQVRVKVGAGGMEFPYQSWWRVDWRRDASGRWLASAIEPVDLPMAGR